MQTVISLVNERRVGAIAIPTSTLESVSYDVVRRICEVMFVTDVEHNLAAKTMVMSGVSPHFAPIAEGAAIPFYVVEFNTEDQTFVVKPMSEYTKAEDSDDGTGTEG